MKSTALLLTIFFLLVFGGHDTKATHYNSDKKEAAGCDRKKLEGLYTYIASPTTFVLREANKMTEKLGDIGVITEYSIRWLSKTSCDHQLIVKKVTTTSKTPESYKPYLLAIGDTLSITVLEVTDKYVAFRTRWKDRVTQEMMNKIPMDALKVK